jgi:hypothetical protein
VITGKKRTRKIRFSLQTTSKHSTPKRWSLTRFGNYQRLKKNPANLNKFENSQRIKYQTKPNTHGTDHTLITSPPQHHLTTSTHNHHLNSTPITHHHVSTSSHHHHPVESHHRKTRTTQAIGSAPRIPTPTGKQHRRHYHRQTRQWPENDNETEHKNRGRRTKMKTAELGEEEKRKQMNRKT